MTNDKEWPACYSPEEIEKECKTATEVIKDRQLKEELESAKRAKTDTRCDDCPCRWGISCNSFNNPTLAQIIAALQRHNAELQKELDGAYSIQNKLIEECRTGAALSMLKFCRIDPSALPHREIEYWMYEWNRRDKN